MTGEQFRHIRTDMGLTQAGLAERIGCTLSTIVRAEKGSQVREPLARHLLLLTGACAASHSTAERMP